MCTLSDRKREELEFHDAYRNRCNICDLDQDDHQKFYGNKKYYSSTALSKRYVEGWIVREAKGRIFLDYCCGDGSVTIKAAKAGASLGIGIDISATSIANARQDAERAGVSQNTYFVQADAENTMLPTDSIDRMICSGVLHHLDLSYAFPEIRRMLVPGGKALTIEALDYNPVIKLYRNLTPLMRTEWEKAHILSLKDIRYAKNFFEIGEIRYWHILGILEAHLRVLGTLLHHIDRILTRIPIIQLMAWMLTFELVKVEE
jgi:ubiquinone/menaquinone biosynthesis C-methylase UbiE